MRKGKNPNREEEEKSYMGVETRRRKRELLNINTSNYEIDSQDVQNNTCNIGKI